jgi:hypothetical protein
VDSPNTTIAPDGNRLARGRARMREIAREDETKRQQLVAELLAELGRPAGAVDRITAKTLAATVVRADRLRMTGRSDIEERRLIVQLQRALGLRPAPAAVQKPSATPGLDYIRERYGQPTSEGR